MNHASPDAPTTVSPDLHHAKLALLAPPPFPHPGPNHSQSGSADKLSLLREHVRAHPALWIAGATVSGLVLTKKSAVLRTVAIALGTRLVLSAVRKRALGFF